MLSSAGNKNGTLAGSEESVIPCEASTRDASATRPQADLYEMVPWLITALADARSSRPELVARLKVVALQLLPPLLDGLHARMLGLLDREQFADVAYKLNKSFLDVLVRPGTACTGASALVPCVCAVKRPNTPIPSSNGTQRHGHRGFGQGYMQRMHPYVLSAWHQLWTGHMQRAVMCDIAVSTPCCNSLHHFLDVFYKAPLSVELTSCHEACVAGRPALSDCTATSTLSACADICTAGGMPETCMF